MLIRHSSEKSVPMGDFTGSRPLLPLPASADGARAGGVRDPLAAVGQRMEVRMIERLADGNVRLQVPATGGGSGGSGDRPGVMVARLAGAMSEALAARAESGQRLMAEVTRSSPSLEVRLLPAAGSPGIGTGSSAETDRLGALLRRTLPAARALAPTLQALSAAATPPDTRADTASTRIDALVRGLPDASGLTRPEGLQQATRASGVWLESMLAQSGTPGSAGPNVSGDLKARLLRAADALRQMPGTGPGGGAGPAPAGGTGPLLEGMLARLASLQLQATGDGADPQRWLFELPFRTPQGVQGLHGEIERHAGEQDGATEGDWRCRLTLDLPALGPTLIVLHSRAGQLHVHFTAERAETVERLQAGQGSLRDNLVARDLEPASLAVRQGDVDTDPQARPDRAHGMLDEQA